MSSVTFWDKNCHDFSAFICGRPDFRPGANCFRHEQPGKSARFSRSHRPLGPFPDIRHGRSNRNSGYSLLVGKTPKRLAAVSANADTHRTASGSPTDGWKCSIRHRLGTGGNLPRPGIGSARFRRRLEGAGLRAGNARRNGLVRSVTAIPTCTINRNSSGQLRSSRNFLHKLRMHNFA